MSYECPMNVLIMSCIIIYNILIYKYISNINRTFCELELKTDICPIKCPDVLLTSLIS